MHVKYAMYETSVFQILYQNYVITHFFLKRFETAF